MLYISYIFLITLLKFKLVVSETSFNANELTIYSTKPPKSLPSVKQRNYQSNYKKERPRAPKHLKLGVIVESNTANHNDYGPTLAEAFQAIRSTLSILQNDDYLLQNTEIVVIEKLVPSGNIFKAIESACEIGQKGASGMIVVAGCTMSLTLRAYAESMKIPTMVTHTCECSIEPQEDRNLEQTIAITTSKSNSKPASDLIMYGSYWFRMGSGYTKILNDCLATLVVQESIKQVLFYADEKSFPHRAVVKFYMRYY